ncbi:MAG: 16S rRNA (adenine(1518)-N(6)/adenine(1519)-N(6))-dimethyltransferase RsmA [Phycisphaerales bacterium]|nr:16S rRNA (adenine(1518)-N(6)/adenine(1519)-N(6))-dimethyltransferase RsmA [Phycisphaerales bacterium]
MQYQIKKSLGQHFLQDKSICKRIIDQLYTYQFINLLEIGPGIGALTEGLLQIPHINFKAIEIDDDKLAYLNKKWTWTDQQLIHGDILKAVSPFKDEFGIIGNFPYNISSQIIFKILDWRQQVPFFVGMFQQEVATRLSAQPNNKDYGVTSVLLQTFYEVSYLFDVPPTCFNPPPKVMSAVIACKRIEPAPLLNNKNQFTALVKCAFNQRRKKLRNALSMLFHKDLLQDSLFDKRAEQLSIQDFINLSSKMYP